MKFFKVDYDLLDHKGKRVPFSGTWLSIEDYDSVVEYLSSLIGYGVRFASIRIYFNEKGVDYDV